MKKVLKLIIGFLGAGLAADILTRVIDTLILGNTSLAKLGNEYNYEVVYSLISLIIFLAVMSLWPVMELGRLSFESVQDMKKAYIRNALFLCIGYFVYIEISMFLCLYTLITVFRDFLLSSLWFYIYISSDAMYIFAPLFATAVFSVVMIAEIMIIYVIKADKLKSADVE